MYVPSLGSYSTLAGTSDGPADIRDTGTGAAASQSRLYCFAAYAIRVTKSRSTFLWEQNGQDRSFDRVRCCSLGKRQLSLTWLGHNIGPGFDRQGGFLESTQARHSRSTTNSSFALHVSVTCGMHACICTTLVVFLRLSFNINLHIKVEEAS